MIHFSRHTVSCQILMRGRDWIIFIPFIYQKLIVPIMKLLLAVVASVSLVSNPSYSSPSSPRGCGTLLTRFEGWKPWAITAQACRELMQGRCCLVHVGYPGRGNEELRPITELDNQTHCIECFGAHFIDANTNSSENVVGISENEGGDNISFLSFQVDEAEGNPQREQTVSLSPPPFSFADLFSNKWWRRTPRHESKTRIARDHHEPYEPPPELVWFDEEDDDVGEEFK